MTNEDYEIAKEFKDRLNIDFNLIDFKVYGSRARGEHVPESDLDIFIVIESITSEQRTLISDLAWEVGFERDRIISTFVATCGQLKDSPLAANPILDLIEEEGVCV